MIDYRWTTLLPNLVRMASVSSRDSAGRIFAVGELHRCAALADAHLPYLDADSLAQGDDCLGLEDFLDDASMTWSAYLPKLIAAADDARFNASEDVIDALQSWAMGSPTRRKPSNP